MTTTASVVQPEGTTLPLLDSSDLRYDAPGLKARADRDGYLYLRGQIPSTDVLELRHFVLEVAQRLDWLDPEAPRGAALSRAGIRLGGFDDPRWIEFMQRLAVDERFDRLRRHPALAPVLTAVFDGPYASERGDVCRVVSSDDPTHTTPPHQDRNYISGSGPLYSVWLPLGDCPLRLGPLAVLPGSHRFGAQPHSGGFLKVTHVPDDCSWFSSPLAMGDVILVSGFTVHRALPNQAGRRLRLSVDYRFTAL